MARTLNETIRTCTDDYLKKIDVDNPPCPADIKAGIITAIDDAVNLMNQIRPKGNKWKSPKRLSSSQICDILLKLHHIIRVKCTEDNTDSSYDLLAVYNIETGIYTTDEDEIKKLAEQYCYDISTKEMNEVIEKLRIHARRVSRTMDRDLIAVNNGVFNYVTKRLEPFSPNYIFLAKSKVNYNPSAVNVTIHNDDDDTDWDVESWMADLSDDPEVVELLWEILSAIVRPHVRWNKSAWFYSSTGNNGKGTLCELMRSLCGDGSFAAIPLSDFSKDFALEPLTRATAIIVDENDVGTFIDKAANLKAVITNDVIPINRKFKTPISYQFYGFMVQCLNEFPRIKDKSDSFYRRQLFVKFDRCFTGKERKYIKNEYLHRDDVLEYVLYKVLNMNFYELSEPASCRSALDEYKEFNDPVRQYLDEILSVVKWDLLPFSFLYDLYKAWFRKNSPNGSIQGRNTFINDVLNLLGDYSDWYCQGRTVQVRVSSKMSNPEPLIGEFGLADWKNSTYTGNNVDMICTPTLKEKYCGLVRNN